MPVNGTKWVFYSKLLSKYSLSGVCLCRPHLILDVLLPPLRSDVGRKMLGEFHAVESVLSQEVENNSLEARPKRVKAVWL